MVNYFQSFVFWIWINVGVCFGSFLDIKWNISLNEVQNTNPFIYITCKITLKEAELKHMSVAFFDPDTIRLPRNFLQKFHQEVGPTVVTESETAWPSSKAVLLVCGNVERLFHIISLWLPIWDPEIFYVIVLSYIPDHYEEIFRDLWNYHHIINVLMLSVKEPKKVVSYNPFFDRITEHDINILNVNNSRNVRTIVQQKTSDLNGYPIRVVMFPTRLKAIPQSDGTYKGSDGILLFTLAKHLNFTPIISDPQDGHKYGWQHDNGTFTGAIGDLVYKRADIAFNGIFIKDYHTDKVQFTTPIHFDQVCFVVPAALTKSLWKAVFLVFDVTIWICLLITYWIVLLTWYVIKKKIEIKFDLVLLCLNLYRTFLMSPYNKNPRYSSERMMVLTAVIFGFIISSSFQGCLVKFLSYKTYEQEIRSIDELHKSGLKILSASVNLKELFETDENPVMSDLLQKFHFTKHKDIFGEIAFHRNSAALGRKNDMEEKIATSYIKNNRSLLHIVEECPRSYHIAYLVPKKSPFVSAFNNIINNLVEAGIMNCWFIHSKPFRPFSDYHTSIKEPQMVFSLENVIIAFIALICGYTLSAIVFVAEILIHSYQTKKNKNKNNLQYPKRIYLN